MRALGVCVAIELLFGCATARTGPEDSRPSLKVSLTRTLPAPPERVWKAWVAEEDVREWWGPRVFTVPVARMDVREGGSSLICMRAPAEMGSQDFCTRWRYTKLVPPGRMEFTLSFADSQGGALRPEQLQLPPGVPPEVRHVITFEPTAGGKTVMTITEYGYTSQQAHDTSLSGLVETVDKLGELLAR